MVADANSCLARVTYSSSVASRLIGLEVPPCLSHECVI
jgi:hypothetical protein